MVCAVVNKLEKKRKKIYSYRLSDFTLVRMFSYLREQSLSCLGRRVSTSFCAPGSSSVRFDELCLPASPALAGLPPAQLAGEEVALTYTLKILIKQNFESPNMPAL